MITFHDSAFHDLAQRGPFTFKKRPCKCHRHFYILDSTGRRLGEIEHKVDAQAVVEGLNRLLGYRNPIG